MIELEFKIDLEQISPKFLKLIKTADVLAIQINCFVMPVRFQIDGEDFFYYKGYPIGPWITQPLIDLSIGLLDTVKKLPKKKVDIFRMNEISAKIILEIGSNNEKIILSFTEHDKSFIVSYKELVKALEKFEKNVKKFLNENAPPLREHPYWGPWLRGEVEWDNDKGLIPIKKPKKH